MRERESRRKEKKKSVSPINHPPLPHSTARTYWTFSVGDPSCQREGERGCEKRREENCHPGSVSGLR